MYLKLKCFFIKLLNYCGIIKLLGLYNKNKAAVLCYHGISAHDEHIFMPSNFMTFEKFKSRINWLTEQGYQFISLDKLNQHIKEKNIPSKTLVLTIDDGFVPCLDQMIPFLIQKKIPATFYITTFYAKRPYPIFRLCLQYMYWRINSIELPLPLLNKLDFQVKNKIDTYDKLWSFISKCESNFTANEQDQILREIEKHNQFAIPNESKKAFSIASLEDLKKIDHDLIDIQLHTHTHHCHDNEEIFYKDLVKNKNLLNQVSSTAKTHFCYPSGIWKDIFFKTLKKLNIKTATTCDPGLVTNKTHPYKIPRFIDSQTMTHSQLEAEIMGLGCLLRKIKKTIKN